MTKVLCKLICKNISDKYKLLKVSHFALLVNSNLLKTYYLLLVDISNTLEEIIQMNKLIQHANNPHF